MAVPVVPIVVGCVAVVGIAAIGAAIYFAIREPERVRASPHRSIDNRSSPHRTQSQLRSPTSGVRRRSANVSSCRSYENCILCLTRPVNIELYPCRAQNLCSVCVPRLQSEVMRNCPDCGRYITRFETM